MNTIDSILPHLSQHIAVIQSLIPKKDKRILLSLAKQVAGSVFLTENQAHLLVKILKENLSAVRSLFQDIDSTLKSNMWSKNFREIQKVRKISIDPDVLNHFVLEFNFNTRLKEKLSKISPNLDGILTTKGSKYIIYFNENNIVTIISTFIKDDFEIDKALLDLYYEIEKIRKTVPNPFDIFSTNLEKLKKVVIADIGDISEDNVLLLQDRKIRYQYEISKKIGDISVASKLAFRTSRKVYANPQEFSFIDLVSAIKQLNRFPALIIFEGQSSEKDKKTLKLVEHAVNSLTLPNEVGIYFRHDKGADTEQFNQSIAELGYNKNLDSNTVIAGISNNRLPKFMVKSGWKPQTIISFTSSFRSNKSSVYCNDVDLVVYYTNTQPLDKEVHALL